MANYSYNSGGSFGGAGGTSWLEALRRLPSAQEQFQNGFWNQSPGAGLDSYLRAVRPSNTNENTVRGLLSNLQAQWVNQQYKDIQNGFGALRPFSEYIGTYNFDRELNRMAPEVRRESPRSFMRPVRTVTF